MRMTRFGLLTAAAAAGGLLAGVARGDDDAPVKGSAPAPKARSSSTSTSTPASGAIPITASLSTLRPGAVCRVELKPSVPGEREKPRSYEGVVTQANDKGVGLALTKGKQLLVRRTLVGQAPILDRLYHAAGAERPALEAMTEVWLSSKAIASIQLVDAARSKKRRLAPAGRAIRSR